MTRGRKKQGEKKKEEVISFRVTTEQKQVLIKNPWLKEELKKEVIHFLNAYKE